MKSGHSSCPRSTQWWRLTTASIGLPNFEGKQWNLRVSASLQSASERAHIALAEGERLLASARAKLLAKREERVRPGRDEKILTSWNGLMIEGMAHAARIFGRDDWLASARAALAFLRDRMWCEDRLLATYKDGRAHLNAYLDDYAFLLAAMLELLQGEWRSEDLGFARDLADALLDKFEDAHTGGFAFTSRDHEELILRPKPGYDNATPSGNGVAAFALQRLGHLVGDARYLTSAERTLRLFQRAMQNQPNAFSTLVAALDENLSPPRVVILRGSSHEMAAVATPPRAHLSTGYVGVGNPRRCVRLARGSCQAVSSSGRQRVGLRRR